MRELSFSPRLCIIILSLILFSAPLEAQDSSKKLSWFAEGSIFIFPDDNDTISDPMPILPSLGFGLSCSFHRFFRLEFTFDTYFTHYGYSDFLNRPIPNAIENRTSQVYGFILALPASGYFELGSVFTIRVFAGPGADLRLVLVAADLNEGIDPMEDIRRQTGLVKNYFWSDFRWFMPVAGLGFDFIVNPRLKFGIDLRAWFPVYRLWTGETLPPIEGWRFAGGVRITFF